MPLSYENYTGDNTTTTFSIPFTYTATSEISVTVDAVAQTGLTFPSASQVQLTSAPASGTVVQVRRTTDLTSRAVDFASGSVLTEEDLDNSNIQIFHSSQEAVDLTNDSVTLDPDDKWDMENKVVKNVANPTNAQDAATKDYLENTWLTPADKAQLNSLNISNLNTVATNIADVNAVAADATDIGTVSTNIASVNTVATNIADVITVANDLNEAISEIETAADDLNEAVSDIDTVSTNIANVNTVGGAIANVNTVGGAIANVNTTATNIGNINTVAGISGNVTTVAGISANVTAVAGDATDIGTVATNIADVNTVAGNNANINTVAGISANVTSVAGNASNINTVAGINSNVTTVANNNANVTTTATNIANINSVAGNSSNINAVAANETNINSVNSNSTNINTVATNISNVNSVGGSIANVNTVASNLASVNNFGEVYRISASAPTTSLDVGDLYFDTTSDTLKVYGASGWQNAGSSINGTSQRYHYDITGTPTSVTGADANGNTLAYDAGYVDVYVNGVRMSTADVTVTSGDTVTFSEALADGDEVDIVGYGTFSVASLNADNLDSGTVPSARVSGAYTGITTAGQLTFADNEKAIFGADSDLQIYHDGTNSIVADVGTGNLQLRGTNIQFMNGTGSQTMAFMFESDTVQLRHNNVTKLATTSSGIDVTGTAKIEKSGQALNLDTPSANQNVWINFSDNGSTKWEISKNTTNLLSIYNYDLGSTVMSFDTAGHVTMPNQPAFLATITAQQNNIATGQFTTINFDNEIYDQNADFNTSTKTFTAPVTGRYMLSANVYLLNVDIDASYIQLELLTSNRVYYHVLSPKFSQDMPYYTANISICADMDASDTAYVRVTQTGGTAQMDISASHFSGYLVA